MKCYEAAYWSCSYFVDVRTVMLVKQRGRFSLCHLWSEEG